MFSYIKGELTEVSPDSVVVETGGIGYGISVPASLAANLPPLGSQVKIYTHLYVREDLFMLYGFFTKDDLMIFRLLLGVSGIGPKGALGILSSVPPDELRFAILSGDVKRISRAPGVGVKTAQRLIIELKDRITLRKESETGDGYETAGTAGPEGDQRSEAVQALAALGYSLTDATKAVHRVKDTKGMSTEDILKEALNGLL